MQIAHQCSFASEEDNEEGVLDILNCSDGHTSVRFNTDSESDTESAKRIIEDMMRRGYTILVETKTGLRRVSKFSRTRGEYIIEEPKTSKAAVKKTQHLSMRKTRATAIGRTAGG